MLIGIEITGGEFLESGKSVSIIHRVCCHNPPSLVDHVNLPGKNDAHG